jgi:nicotinamide/nicotinate riboside kinase
MTAIGVAGVTCGGKTTLAQRLVNMIRAEKKSAVTISQDDFFLSKMEVPRIWNKDDPSVLFYDYDNPKSLDDVKLAEAIDQALVDYQFVIVDGNMLTEFPHIVEKLAKIIFVTLDKHGCLKRRVHRIDYDPPDVPGYFDQIVWPAYEQHVARVQPDNKCVFVDGSVQLDDAFLRKLLDELDRDLVRIQSEAISIDQLTQFVTTPSSGAISLFIGLIICCLT